MRKGRCLKALQRTHPCHAPRNPWTHSQPRPLLPRQQWPAWKRRPDNGNSGNGLGWARRVYVVADRAVQYSSERQDEKDRRKLLLSCMLREARECSDPAQAWVTLAHRVSTQQLGYAFLQKLRGDARCVWLCERVRRAVLSQEADREKQDTAKRLWQADAVLGVPGRADARLVEALLTQTARQVDKFEPGHLVRCLEASCRTKQTDFTSQQTIAARLLSLAPTLSLTLLARCLRLPIMTIGRPAGQGGGTGAPDDVPAGKGAAIGAVDDSTAGQGGAIGAMDDVPAGQAGEIGAIDNVPVGQGKAIGVMDDVPAGQRGAIGALNDVPVGLGGVIGARDDNPAGQGGAIGALWLCRLWQTGMEETDRSNASWQEMAQVLGAAALQGLATIQPSASLLQAWYSRIMAQVELAQLREDKEMAGAAGEEKDENNPATGQPISDAVCLVGLLRATQVFQPLLDPGNLFLAILSKQLASRAGEFSPRQVRNILQDFAHDNISFYPGDASMQALVDSVLKRLASCRRALYLGLLVDTLQSMVHIGYSLPLSSSDALYDHLLSHSFLLTRGRAVATLHALAKQGQLPRYPELVHALLSLLPSLPEQLPANELQALHFVCVSLQLEYQSFPSLALPARLVAACQSHCHANHTEIKNHTARTNLQQTVSKVLRQEMGLMPEEELSVHGLLVDLAFPEEKIAIEVDGPSHFCRSANGMVPTGATRAKQRLLSRAGWRVVNVPWFEWSDLGTSERALYLQRKLSFLLCLERPTHPFEWKVYSGYFLLVKLSAVIFFGLNLQTKCNINILLKFRDIFADAHSRNFHEGGLNSSCFNRQKTKLETNSSQAVLPLECR
eukprot:g38434.t1